MMISISGEMAYRVLLKKKKKQGGEGFRGIELSVWCFLIIEAY